MRLSLFSRFVRRGGVRWIARVSQQLAARSCLPVCESLSCRVSQMNRAEARGYIRAKTTPVVCEAVDEFLRNRGTVAPATRRALVETTTEHVVETVLDQVANRPHPSSAARRAA